MGSERQSHVDARQQSVSAVFILVIIVVLFFVFFQDGHNLKYTVDRADAHLQDASFSGITHGSPMRRIARLLLALFCGALLIRKRSPFLAFRSPIGKLLVVFLLWAAFSYFWATDSGLVARRVLSFCLISYSALVIAETVSLRQLRFVVLGITTLFLTVGLASERALRTWWPGVEGYRFSGTCHPVAQGMNCAMLMLAAVAIVGKERGPVRVFGWVMMVIGFLFLVLTRSRGPFVGALLALLVYYLYTRPRSRIVVVFYVLLVAFLVAVLLFGDAFVESVGLGLLLGREEERILDLNGRLALWRVCAPYVNARPILGYGFSGFWTEERARRISDSFGWRVDSSHSMYIETTLNLGMVGLLVFVGVLFLAWVRTRRLCETGENDGAHFALSLLTLWIADGVLSTLVVGRGFVTFLLLVVLFGISRESCLQREQGMGVTGRAPSSGEGKPHQRTRLVRS